MACKIKLNPYRLEKYSQELINKYKTPENMLKHARFDEDKSRGYFIINRKDDALIGYIAFEGDMIIALETEPKYQGKGYAKKLLDYALSLGANRLTVAKSNKNAIDIYKHLGWKKYKQTDKIEFYKKKAG